jgi:hypothetical protein
MLRHVFYALLGGYFVGGLLIGLNWFSAVYLGTREPTAIQHAERSPAPIQDNRKPGAESADNTDVIIRQALQYAERSLAPIQDNRKPGAESADNTDVALTSQRKSSGNRSNSPPAVLQLPHPDQRTARGPPTVSDTLQMKRPQPSGPQSLQPAQVDTGSLPTVRVINQASIPHPRTAQPGSTSMPQTLQAAQVDTGAPPKVPALPRAQQGRKLLEAPRKPVELVNDSISGPSFDGAAEPPPTKLGMAIDSKSRANSDSIPPKTIRQVFTLGCSLLLPTITAGNLSNGKGMEIGRMQADYLKKAECLVAAKRATRTAKRKIGCRCTAETKELDAAAHVPLWPNAPVPVQKPRYRR